MTPSYVLIAILVCGIDVGWKADPDGGVEYIIQISPGSIDSLQEGKPFESYVPENFNPIRRFQIRMGTGKLPQDTIPARPKPAAPPEVNSPEVKETESYFLPFLAALGSSSLFLVAFVYLGWLHMGIRSRFREQLLGPGATPSKRSDHETQEAASPKERAHSDADTSGEPVDPVSDSSDADNQGQDGPEDDEAGEWEEYDEEYEEYEEEYDEDDSDYEEDDQHG